MKLRSTDEPPATATTIWSTIIWNIATWMKLRSTEDLLVGEVAPKSYDPKVVMASAMCDLIWYWSQAVMPPKQL